MAPPSFRSIEKKMLVKVLKEYKRHRCLWDITHQDYHNQEARNCAMGYILRVWHKIDHTVTYDYVKMKLLNMRTNYTRQRKKVETSLASGATGDDLYKPTLWYYPHLDFLTANSGTKKGSDDSPESDNDSDDEDINGVNTTLRNMHKNVSSENEKVEESAAAFGRLVGVQVSKLPEMQRWIAEKLISEVLFHAKLSHLTETSTIKSKQEVSTATRPESDTIEVPVPADIVPKEEPEDEEMERETLLVVQEIKSEEDETENAVKFLQMY